MESLNLFGGRTVMLAILCKVRLTALRPHLSVSLPLSEKKFYSIFVVIIQSKV
jgi:hypothetical protein